MGGMDIEELFRLITNLIRVGTVSAVDLASRPAVVRVSSGALESNWVPYLELRAGTTTTWDPPTVGEAVVLFSPEGDPANGIAMRGLNTEEIPAPSTSADEWVRLFPDGARLVYNHATSALVATGIKTARIEASEQFTLQCPDILLDGRVTVTDLFSYQAGMAGVNSKGNRTTIRGDITHEDGDLKSNGVTLHTHTHGGVYRGGESTDEPSQS